jgi:quinol monooxygenase YgiN
MTIMMKFELSAKGDSIKDISNFFNEILPGTREFPGCEGAYIAYSEEEKSKFVLIEYWRASGDFDKYIEWRTNIGDFARLNSMLASEPNIKPFTLLAN